MAVTEQKSAILQQKDESPQNLLTPREFEGRIRFHRINFTQDGNGDANSLADLAELPPGRVRVLGGLSKVYYDAFGSSRTLDIGHTGYTQRDGTSKSAVVDFFVDGEDVSGAGNTEFDNVDHQSDNGLDADHTKEFDSVEGVTIQAKVLGGTIPDGTKLWGWVAYVVD
jgi:hypothetical protein